jgi:endonuclease/exonuclease/phosphatase (EEP) superfamily protein YafD
VLRAAAGVLAVYPLAIFALIALTAVLPQRAGPLALVPIAAPHLLLSTLLLVPLVIFARAPLLVVALALCAILAVVRFGDEWVSWPGGGPQAGSLRLVSWNLQLGARTPAAAVSALREQEADVIALQELTDDVSAAIEGDPVLGRRFPYRALEPDRGAMGLGLLSVYPITDQQLHQDPASLTATLSLEDGRGLVIMNAHPMPGTIGPLSFDGRQRDAALGRLRDRIEPLLAGALPLVVIGDLNVASSEPSYGIVAQGMRDAHREVGLGPGWTWRPERLIRFGVGLLRIDYVLSSPSIAPRSISVDCGRRGDHCLVAASVDVP